MVRRSTMYYTCTKISLHFLAGSDYPFTRNVSTCFPHHLYRDYYIRTYIHSKVYDILKSMCVCYSALSWGFSFWNFLRRGGMTHSEWKTRNIVWLSVCFQYHFAHFGEIFFHFSYIKRGLCLVKIIFWHWKVSYLKYKKISHV